MNFNPWCHVIQRVSDKIGMRVEVDEHFVDACPPAYFQPNFKHRRAADRY
jgi:hypothetical protein